MVDRIGMIRAALFRARCRSANRFRDLLAVLSGYCNHRPWSPIPGEGGGYAHWRCGRRRGHVGLHRAVNYVWGPDGRTDYVPSPVGRRDKTQPWTRHSLPTRRQERARRRWLATEYAEQLARLREAGRV